MRRNMAHRLAAGFALAATTACGLISSQAVPSTEYAETPGSRNLQMIVISGDEIRDESRPLLDILRKRVPGLQVRQTDECPEVIIRGRSTLITPSNPSIYVDGQHTSNTCVLEGMDTADIARVEVYPMGVSQRPGVMANPYGLILIYSRQQNE
ncbi:MAG TPA: Plug domain-containing protein [Gemmatimonadaceae bacterium]